MKNRPIDSLVEALRSLGVVIEYKGREGYPPILVRGGRIDGGRVEVSAEILKYKTLQRMRWRNVL